MLKRLGLALAAFAIVVAGPAAAGIFVFKIDVTSAKGVSGFMPFSFDETYTLAPGSSSTMAAGPQTLDYYQGHFTTSGTPVTSSLLSLVDLTGATYMGNFNFVHSMGTGSNHVQGVFFEGLNGPMGSYSQSINSLENILFTGAADEAGLAVYLASAGAAPWGINVSRRGLPVASYSGVVTLLSWRAAIPEPSTWAFMILGLGGLGVAMRRRAQTVPA